MRLAEWFGGMFAPETTVRYGGVTLPSAKPRLVAVTFAPSLEEFAAWRDDRVTLFVFAALRNMAAEQKQAWDAMAWHGGDANQQLLTELRTRADAYEAMETSGYEDFCAGAGVSPDNEANNAV